MLANMRHPRKRAVSVGPQSVADAYETLAYRQKRRRESISSPDLVASSPVGSSIPEDGDYLSTPSQHQPYASGNRLDALPGADMLPTPVSSRVHSYEQVMGAGNISAIPLTPAASEKGSDVRSEEEREDQKLFLALERPRVRYDVEVVTKLIVYSGTCDVEILRVCTNTKLLRYCMAGG